MLNIQIIYSNMCCGWFGLFWTDQLLHQFN